MIKHLKARWLLAAMLLAVGMGELVAWQICSYFHLRYPPVPIAALCVGAVAAFVAWQYDGTD